jgi:hypothetical protein
MNKQRTGPSAHTVHYAALTFHKPLPVWSPDEARTRGEDVGARLQQTMQRERASLDHSAAQGARTPTDEADEADQAREVELIGLCDEIARDLAGK